MTVYKPARGSDTCQLPLRNRAGEVVAHATIDTEDEHLANHRWSMHPQGYAQTRVDGKRMLLHRVVMGLTTGDGKQVDHINRSKLDCRRDNLRLSTHTLNGQNVGSHPHSASRFRNVYWDKPRLKWTVRAQTDGRLQFLGRFDSEVVAAAVAAQFRADHMPFSSEATAYVS